MRLAARVHENEYLEHFDNIKQSHAVLIKRPYLARAVLRRNCTVVSVHVDPFVSDRSDNCYSIRLLNPSKA